MKSLTYIELDADFCANTYGVAPCTASVGVTGDAKCFNTIKTCQDRPNFVNEPVTIRFGMDVDYLPTNIDCIPSLRSVDVSPQVVSLGKDLGQRATVTATFTDHQHSDTGPGGDPYVSERPYDPWSTGTFWGKWVARQPYLRGRPFRVIRGIVGQTLAEMDTRHYILESFEGPDPQTGGYSMIAKDMLKFADDDRAQAPVMSRGNLAGSIDNDDLAAILTPAGIGDLEYPASGYVCFGGKEVCSFTRSGNNLTIVRGQLGTQPQAHTAGDRAQLVLRYDGDTVADIIEDLLVNYASVDPVYVPSAAWATEVATYLSTIYAATVTEPTSVKTLLSELVEQAALALFWDERSKVIQLKVLREIATDAALFNADNILEGSLRVKQQPESRISQMWTYFGQRNPTQTPTDPDNYRAAALEVDLEKETDYGSLAVNKVIGRFIGTENAADRLNAIKLSRFRDPPRRFGFSVFTGTPVDLGGGYRLSWWGNQDQFGVETDAPIQVTRVKITPDVIEIEAEEMLASGVIVVTQTVLLRTTGSVLNWTVPASWNDAENIVQVIGGGAGGHYNGAAGASGGGAGAYSEVVNIDLTPAALVQYRVGSGGLGQTGGSAATSGSDTWFGGATLGASTVGAKAGVTGIFTDVGGLGGAAASGVGTTRYSGGNGGNGAPRGESRAGGGGGGGAAGPNGNGGNGGSLFSGNHEGGGGGGGADGGANGSISSGYDGGPGGHNRFNYGGGTSSNADGQQGGGGFGGNGNDSPPTAGGRGGDGEQIWTQTISPIISAGPGGGGGGGGAYSPGGHAGLYGGGGGGTGGSSLPAGNGAQGIIAISWREV
jgi:hypothetical protein